MSHVPYEYTLAEVIKVVDGDTIDLRVISSKVPFDEEGDADFPWSVWFDMGFHVQVRYKMVYVYSDDHLGGQYHIAMQSQTAHRFRLVRIDTPERAEVNWAEATAHFAKWLKDRQAQIENGLVTVRTHKGDAFGRWLCEIVDNDGNRVTDSLLAAGLAIEWVR